MNVRRMLIFILALAFGAVALSVSTSLSAPRKARAVEFAAAEAVHFLAAPQAGAFGSAVVIAPGVAITAKHVVGEGTEALWDGKTDQPVIVRAAENDTDLALLLGSAIQCPCVSPGIAQAENGADVLAVGYPGGRDLANALKADEPIRYLIPGYIVWSNEVYILHNTGIASGMSGGALFRCNPRECVLAGILVMGVREGNIAISVSGLDIAKFLKGT